MKKLNNILILLSFVSAFVLFSCSDNDDLAIVSSINSVDEFAEKNTIVMPAIVHEENWEDNPEVSSKSTLAYNYSAGNLKFSWIVGDNIGVYPVKYMDKGTPQTTAPESSAIQPWVIKEVQPSSTISRGFFQTDDEDIKTYRNQSYIAVFPYIDDDTDYRDIPITYEGQKQSASAMIGAYINRADPDEETKYVNSEKAACSHLSAYDYLVDTERAATEDGGKMHFQMKRLSSMVRFYMKVPKTIVFDSLQLYNPSKEFTLRTTLDASTGEYAAVPAKKSHAMSLQLNDYGFDYTSATADDDFYYSATTKWVMICYMMVAPIDLSEEKTSKSTLYLLGREPLCYENVDDYNKAWGTSKTSEEFAALTTAQKIRLYDNVADYNTDNHKSLSAEEFAALTTEARRMVYPDVEAFNAAKETALTSEDFEKLTTGQKITRFKNKYYKASLVKKNLTSDFLYQWSTALAEDTPITFEEITIQQWTEGPGFTNKDGAGTEDW